MEGVLPYMAFGLTILANLAAIVFTFGTLTTRLSVAEKTLEELRTDFKGFSDLKASIAEIRLQQVHSTQTLDRLERLIEKLSNIKEVVQ